MADVSEDGKSTVEEHSLIVREFKTVAQPDPEKSFRVLQYNILAEALSRSTPDENFCKVPPGCLTWSFRSNQLLKQILSFSADIVCLEEVDHFQDFFAPELSLKGYQGTFAPKKQSPCLKFPNNNGPDGVAIFYLADKFNKKEEITRYLKNEDGQEGSNVILVNVFEDIKTKCHLIVGVTHLKAKRGFEDRRKAQTECCMGILNTVASNYSDGTIILCGDFNGEPGEPFYKALQDSDYRSCFVDAVGEEPEYTTWKIRPSSEEKHTIDYIWQHVCNCLRVTGVLLLMSDESVSAERFPSFDQPSDHIPLCFEFTRS